MTDQPIAPAVVSYLSGTRLEQLHAAYHQAKADATEATAKLKAATDAIKVELTTAAPGSTSIDLTGCAGAPLRLGYVETWRFDSKRLKAEDPQTYVRYAKKSGSWVLRTGSEAAAE